MTADPSTKPAPSKSDFVRAAPATMTASEIVAAGKKVGLAITTGLVHSVRSRARKNPGPPRRRGRPSKADLAARAKAAPAKRAHLKKAAPAAAGSLKGDERELARLMVTVGLERSAEVLARLVRLLG